MMKLKCSDWRKQSNLSQPICKTVGPGHMHSHREKVVWGHFEKEVIYKLREETSEKTRPADALVLDFWPPELCEISFCYLGNLVDGILLLQP